MRDFFWFAVLTFAMVLVGDYQTKMKTVAVVQPAYPERAIAAQSPTSEFAFLSSFATSLDR
jgi:hypothetical protein